MTDPKLELDSLPGLSAEDHARILAPETMSSLFATIRPHLEPGKRKLVYIFPASGRIGHVVGELFALWTLHGAGYDEILVVVRDRASLPIPEGPARLVAPYMRFVETSDHLVMLLGHYNAPLAAFGPFDLLLTSAARLCHALFPTLRAEGFERHFALPEDMAARGEAWLRGLGWRPGEPIVPVHAREPSFLSSHRYHFFRTADIANYRPAIDRLADGGTWVFRLGDRASRPLSHPSPRVVDLPHREDYADWMDVFLVAKARYSINCSSGPVSYCHPLGTPTLLINNYAQPFCLLAPTARDLLMFKRYRETASGRYLSYEEILARDLTDCSEVRHFEAAGVALEENSPADILDAVVEMEARLAGTHVPDETAQTAFRETGIAHDRERLARVAAGTARQATQEAPHYCFGFPWVSHAEGYCRHQPGFLPLGRAS